MSPLSNVHCPLIQHSFSLTYSTETALSSCQISNKNLTISNHPNSLRDTWLTSQLLGGESSPIPIGIHVRNDGHKVMVGCGLYMIPTIHAQAHPAVYWVSQPVLSSFPFEACLFLFPLLNLSAIMEMTLQTYLSFWVILLFSFLRHFSDPFDFLLVLSLS